MLVEKLNVPADCGHVGIQMSEGISELKNGGFIAGAHLAHHEKEEERTMGIGPNEVEVPLCQ